METWTLMAAAAFTASGAAAALADDKQCEARIGDWCSAVARMAEGQRKTVQRIKTDDGGYEILCTDEDSCTFEAIVDPATVQVLATEVRAGGRPIRQRQ